MQRQRCFLYQQNALNKRKLMKYSRKSIMAPRNHILNKILFNHQKFIGDENLFSIGGLNDLNKIIKLKNNKQASIRHLLKSLPASEGMSSTIIPTCRA
jgi:hypothetical protein